MIEHAVLGFFGFLSWTEPDIAALAEWLDGRVNVARISGSAMLCLQVVEHPRPEFAASVVEMMHENADALLRESALERTGAQISRVERELAAANSPTREQALEEVLVGLYQAPALAPRRSALRRPGRGTGDRERAADLAQPVADPGARPHGRSDPRHLRGVPARRIARGGRLSAVRMRPEAMLVICNGARKSGSSWGFSFS